MAFRISCTSVVHMSTPRTHDAASRPRIQPAEAGDTRSLSISARLGRLQFHNSGKFRVLQLADIQDGPRIAADTIRLIEAAADTVRPDLVVFTGNQIAGYDEAYADTFRRRRWETPGNEGRGFALWKSARNANKAKASEDVEHTRSLVRSSIEQFIEPLNKRSIPWAVTYGNHDAQCGLDYEEMDAIYRSLPGCLNPAAPESSLDDGGVAQEGAEAESIFADGYCHALPDQKVIPCEPGSFVLPVSDVTRSTTVFNLAVMNSGDYAHEGGYGHPSQRALQLLRALPSLGAEKSCVFQHLPVEQFYQLLKEVPPTANHAIEGYRTFGGRYFVLDEGKTLAGGYLGEGISCPDVDSGEFDILRDSGCFALICGHDHRNAFVGEVDGITLMATPTCGFGSYGPVGEKRAARLIEFDIRHPYSPRTQLLEFGALVGKPNARKAYTYGLSSQSRAREPEDDLLRRPTWWRRVLDAIFHKR